jgi:hypothetical protein
MKIKLTILSLVAVVSSSWPAECGSIERGKFSRGFDVPGVNSERPGAHLTSVLRRSDVEVPFLGSETENIPTKKAKRTKSAGKSEESPLPTKACLKKQGSLPEKLAHIPIDITMIHDHKKAELELEAKKAKMKDLEQKATEIAHREKDSLQAYSELVSSIKEVFRRVEENSLDAAMNGLLFCGIRYRCDALMRFILAKKKSFPQIDSHALILAAGAGIKWVCKSLMEEPFCVDANVRSGEPLCRAAENSFPDVCKFLVSKENMPAKADIRLSWALRRAVENGHIKVCHELLTCSVPAKADDLESEALMIAVQTAYFKPFINDDEGRDRHLALCKILLDAPSHPAKANARDSLALVLACKSGNVKLVKLLLSPSENNKYPARADARNGAALMAAVEGRNFELCELLLSFHPSNYVKANVEKSLALERAAAEKYDEICDLLMHPEIMETFDSPDAYEPFTNEIRQFVALVSDREYAAFHAAVKAGDREICEMFVEEEIARGKPIGLAVLTKALEELTILKKEDATCFESDRRRYQDVFEYLSGLIPMHEQISSASEC